MTPAKKATKKAPAKPTRKKPAKKAPIEERTVRPAAPPEPKSESKTEEEAPKVAEAPDAVTLDDVTKVLAETFTKDGVERVLHTTVRALGNVTPLDAVHVGEGQQVLAWARLLPEGL